jgi:hypothetical protein
MTTLPLHTPPRNKQARNLKQYTSPRCDLDDDELFLPSGQSLKHHEDRWQHMQQQAGSHQQDLQVLDLTNRILSPQTLKVGVPPQVALRITELHVNLHSEYSLPEWLDVVCFLFFRLQHFYTTNIQHEECISSEDTRMRRLYILYRLPDLRSIDGKHVTAVERGLARPSSPNGAPVKLQDWVAIQDGDDDENDDESCRSEDDSSVLQSHGDAVEVNLFGVVKRVSADPPRENWEEPELPKPFEPLLPEKVQVNVTKSVERANRSIRKVPLTSQIKTPSSSCGGLAAAFADVNPCVASSRTTTLDEPYTVDYPTTITKKENSVNKNDVRRIDKGRQHGSSRSTKQKEKTAPNVSTCTSPERRPRPTTPEAKKSPSSLSSPFPMQFRSKSFNGTLPTTMTKDARLPPRVSSPDLSPTKTATRKGTIHDYNPVTAGTKSPKSIRKQQRAERPPPVPPGASRRVAPPNTESRRSRRRGWRSKNSIRSTSIVDDDDDDEDCISDDEDVIEHA